MKVGDMVTVRELFRCVSRMTDAERADLFQVLSDARDRMRENVSRETDSEIRFSIAFAMEEEAKRQAERQAAEGLSQ